MDHWGVYMLELHTAGPLWDPGDIEGFAELPGHCLYLSGLPGHYGWAIEVPRRARTARS